MDFIRKNYENTLLTMSDVCKIFNKKFKLSKTNESLSNAARKNGIKKNPDIKYKMQLENIKKAHQAKRKLGPTKWTSEVVSFIRKCSREGLTSKQTGEKAQIYFGGIISLSTVRLIGYREKIKFALPSVENEPEIFKTKKFQKFMALKKNQGMKMYVLDSRIIERFEIHLGHNNLKNYCRRKGIKYL